MNTWLTIRTFVAIFLSTFGLGLMFIRSQDERLLLGSVIAAFGLTFLLRMALEVRRL